MATAAQKYSQEKRPIMISTPLGKDVLLLESFSGTEAVSELFQYRADLLAEDPSKVAFDKILGQSVTVTVMLPGEKKRYLNGIVSRLTQGNKVAAAKKDTTFVRYRAEIVPQFWFLTKKLNSRIFQQLSVPDILKTVLTGLTVSYQLQGTYQPRDYCVQYRESDFHFASRLMQEEGIFYFYKHADGSHEMVVADSSQSHADMPEISKVTFEESGDHRVYKWEKNQFVRSGKYVLWDYSFEMPDKHLEAEQPVLASAASGTVTHKLNVASNDQLEQYEYPGGYANRFDGVAPGGGDRASDLQKIFDDNQRTVAIRMEQESAGALIINGESDCRQFATGHKFTLDRHYDANGSYVLTRLKQAASLAGAYTTGGRAGLDYTNQFECLPMALPFRPKRTIAKPLIHGTQTAMVVGTSGQEIFTDKYGRVKVQFHWDRLGKADANSSCWIRVATSWAGQQWGAIQIPRIGQEVVVAFIEGDPDQPIIVGSVYNANLMPPYTLPDNMTQSVLKTRSTLKGEAENFNELRFEDKKDEEQIYFHAEKNFDRVVENNDTLKVGSDKADDGSQTIEIWKDRTTTIKQGNETWTLEKGSRTETIKEGDDTLKIEKGNRTAEIKKDDTLTVEGKQTITVTGDVGLTVKTGNYSAKIDAGTATIEAAQSIELKVGGNSIKIDPSGITIKGTMITIQGTTITTSGTTITTSGTTITTSGAVTISGATCAISSGAVTIG